MRNNAEIRVNLSFMRNAHLRASAVKAAPTPVPFEQFLKKKTFASSVKKSALLESVRYVDPLEDEVGVIRSKFAESRRDLYARLASQFSDSDCGCNGEED